MKPVVDRSHKCGVQWTAESVVFSSCDIEARARYRGDTSARLGGASRKWLDRATQGDIGRKVQLNGLRTPFARVLIKVLHRLAGV
jgi:hypothetical protein